MSVKNDLLNRIKRDADKIKAKRVDAANNKSLESAVFDFFKNIEGSRLIHGGKKYDETLFISAKKSLKERAQGFAPGTKIAVEFNSPEDITKDVYWAEQQVRGVTIYWGQSYLSANNVDATMYIDISQLLFF